MEHIAARFLAELHCPHHVTLRLSREQSETVSVRQGITQPVRRADDLGASVTVTTRSGGQGWAGTCDITATGLRAALERATKWAEWSAPRAVDGLGRWQPSTATGSWSAPNSRPWGSLPLKDKIDLLQQVDGAMAIDDRIVDRVSALWHTEVESLLVNTSGAHVAQRATMLLPTMDAVASDANDTQQRTLDGRGYCRQGGLEILDEVNLLARAPELADEALQLLTAPSCPTGTMSLVIAPDQMVLQVHESIGHPLELDRILGDERNYAGTSFVTPDMFGTYRYGSDLLNVTFDPGVEGEFASYRWDDEGGHAERVYIIKDGILQRPLGGALSQVRAGLPGTANSRATSWNRPPIDRMANLNVEPGGLSQRALIGQVERGVLMRTNVSWSIDDSRNKFQFGCEWGQMIIDGEIAGVVKKPNYRGISSTFWRNLAGVGDASTWQLHGSPYCGKGEPNQVIRVGHATPMCHFRDVDVFGGVS